MIKCPHCDTPTNANVEGFTKVTETFATFGQFFDWLRADKENCEMVYRKERFEIGDDYRFIKTSIEDLKSHGFDYYLCGFDRDYLYIAPEGYKND